MFHHGHDEQEFLLRNFGQFLFGLPEFKDVRPMFGIFLLVAGIVDDVIQVIDIESAVGIRQDGGVDYSVNGVGEPEGIQYLGVVPPQLFII